MKQKGFEKGDKEITFDLKINATGEFMIDEKKGYYKHTIAHCAPKDRTAIPPDAWRITKDKYLKGEYLLVFSLLPPSVSRVWNGKEFEETAPSTPKCDLFLQFSTEHYRLLTAIRPPNTTTSTTKTTTTTTTETPSTTTRPECPIAAAPTCPTAPTTKRPAEKECNIGVFVLIGIFVSLVVGLCLGGISFWFWMKRTERKKTEKEKTEKEKKEERKDPEQSEDDPLRVLYDAEVKEKGPDAVGTFDKWKENRMKTESNVSAQEPDPVDKAESKKKGETAAEREERVMKKWTEDWYEMLRKNEYEPAKREGRFKGTFEDYKKMRPIPETKTLCENFQMVKTAVVADKSVVDKGKSTSGAVKINKKVKSATTVVESEPTTKTAMGTKKSTSTVIEMPQTSEATDLWEATDCVQEVGQAASKS
ncbi:hypothetical protein Mgra_00001627 [Meloidogyne graminicola]|uniref:Uncharacterized protein n=1 Tax=Meloidogyne graminicola TaxID=189291 RepID=A0A8T0A0H9_9BILA|nr:hypothetical protein Mgra_00001627 [Meloidogyne graminicola]